MRYTAPVGVILQGEGGILYGKPALGCSLDAWVTGQILKRPGLKKIAPLYFLEVVKEVEKEAKKKLKEQLNMKIFYPKNIHTEFEGIQAAEIVVATALVYNHLVENDVPIETINNIAFRVHKKINPTASGLYTSLSAFGGLIYFRKEFEFLKGIYKLAYKIPPQIAQELSVSLPSPEAQQKIAHDISALFKKNPAKAEALLAAQEKATKRTLVAIVKGDKKMFFDQFTTAAQTSAPRPYPFTQSYTGLKAV